MENVDVLLNFYNKICIEINNNINDKNKCNNLSNIIQYLLLLIKLLIKTNNNNNNDLINLKNLLMSMSKIEKVYNIYTQKSDYKLIIKKNNTYDILNDNNINVNSNYKITVIDILLNFYNYLCIKIYKKINILNYDTEYNNLLKSIIEVFLDLINLKDNNNNNNDLEVNNNNNDELKNLLISIFDYNKDNKYNLNYNLIIKKDNKYVKLENHTIKEIKSDNEYLIIILNQQ